MGRRTLLNLVEGEEGVGRRTQFNWRASEASEQL